VGVIGAGNYASRTLLPALRKTQAVLKSVASMNGVSGVYAGRRFGFQETTTDASNLLTNPDINTVIIATRHDSHARFVCEALRAGKHVFVEKPLALTREELEEIEETYAGLSNGALSPRLMVGFNRRFAPQVRRMKSLLEGIKEPKAFVMLVNAGAIPLEHWTQNPRIGGGRIIGEGCHFIDLLRFLAGCPIVGIQVTMLGDLSRTSTAEDKMSFTLRFADGSFGIVHYLANGHRSFPKERLEVFCAGKVLELSNFRCLRGYGWPGFRKMRLWRQDKGHTACMTAFIDAVQQGEPSPISFEELVEVTRASFEVVEAIRQSDGLYGPLQAKQSAAFEEKNAYLTRRGGSPQFHESGSGHGDSGELCRGMPDTRPYGPTL
jgi:predicted dehydrogenase